MSGEAVLRNVNEILVQTVLTHKYRENKAFYVQSFPFCLQHNFSIASEIALLKIHSISNVAIKIVEVTWYS